MRDLPALASSSLGPPPLPPPGATPPAEAESVDEEMERGSCVTCLCALAAAIALGAWHLAMLWDDLYLNQLLRRGVGLRLIQQAVFSMRLAGLNPREIGSGLAKRPENYHVHPFLRVHRS